MISQNESFGIVLAKDVMVPMRDGVALACDIYRPGRDGEPAPGQFPVILSRTPYDKTDKRYSEVADFFVPRGYVVVLQDLRDRYRSQGHGEYFHTYNKHDGTDGYDTIEWIAARPWSNGRVGMTGSSFAGLVQTRAALLRPPHLTAIWPDVSPTNSFAHQAREGGAMQLHMFWALFMHAQDAHEIREDFEAQRKVWDGLRHLRTMLMDLLDQPFKRGKTPLAVVPNLEDALFEYYQRGDYDNFWADLANDFERHFHMHADIPGTFTGGWFDPYCPAMTGHFATMKKKNRSPQRLIMGPWTHVAMRGDSTYVGDVDFGPQSVWGVTRYCHELLRWFDRWLKDEDNNVTADPPVRIFVMGGGDGRRTAQGKFNHGGQWRDEHEWPLARTRYTAYHLHADGSLDPQKPLEKQAFRSFTFDPKHPVPTVGGALCGIMELPAEAGELDPMWRRFLSPVTLLRHVVPTGPAHQATSPRTFAAREPFGLLADRDDVLVFQTPPLEQPMEVTGSITVNLFISSTAPDTDFTAKLIDAAPANEDYPDGYHMNLVDSILRVRYRNGFDHQELMTPGEIYPITITLPATSNLFAVGHRIRLDVSSSNFPRLDVNPNTGEPIGKHTHTATAVNTVHMDAAHPSHVVLPIIPR